MNFIKRAILSSKARIGKTAILFLVMVTVCSVVLTSFGIKSAAEKSSVLARQKLGAEVTLKTDMEKLRHEAMNNLQNNGERIKMEQVGVPLSYLDELKDFPYIKSYLISTSTGANIDGVTAVGSDTSESESSNKNMPPMGDMKKMSHGDFSLSGVNELSLSQEYQNGKVEITEGRAITSEDDENSVAVIEETLAAENNLKLGDKITVYSPVNEDEKKELEIVGIYKNSSDFTDDAFNNTSNSPFNKIFVPCKVAGTLKGETYNSEVDQIVFYLDDPVNVEKFILEGENTTIDFNKFILDGNNDDYETMMGPIENVASFSNMALIVVTIFGGVILALIIMLSVKDRINEIGILLSLGESKFKIIGQFLAEILLVLVISLGAVAIAGGPISNAISNELLAKEITVSEKSEKDSMPMRGPNMGMDRFNPSKNNKVETIEELNVQITPKEFSKMSIVAILIAIIATIIPAGFIMRLHPKTILSKHD